MIRPLKQAMRRFRLHHLKVRKEVSCPAEEFGADGGLWHLNPEPLNANSIVYSFGVGDDATFDTALIDRFGLEVHAFDPTPASIEWVRAQSLPEQYIFHDFGIADHDGTMEFWPPRRESSAHYTPVPRYLNQNNATRVLGTVQRLRTTMKQLGHDHIDLMKIDIEGGEYDVIADIVADELPIRQLLIEFHHNYRTIPIQRTIDALQSLHAAGFRIFHISERTYEISMMHRDVVQAP